MRIAIYSPYLDTLGGGERYISTIASELSFANTVDMLLDSHLFNLGGDYLKKELSKRFNLNLNTVNFIKAPIGKNSSLIFRLFFLKKYDILFYLTDGSIFFPTSKRNILHIQSPLVGQSVKSAWGKFKLNNWDLIIYNSKFTQNNSIQNWPIKSEVVYPPVDTVNFKPLKKKKYILSVGRFFGYLKDKKYEILIKSFIELYKNDKINGWSLHLAGSATKGDELYLKELKSLSKGFPINFYPNISFNELTILYGESILYWHAAGYEETDPTKMEHFGISTVEAMAAGAVPIVIAKGGQVEIVEDKVSGYLWNSRAELKELTLALILDSKLREKVSKKAILRSADFGEEKFACNLVDLIANLN